MWWNCGSGRGSWWMFPHGLFSIIFLLLLIAGLIWFFRNLSGAGAKPVTSALTILEERYARGEIDREEFLRRKGDISNRGATGQTGRRERPFLWRFRR